MSHEKTPVDRRLVLGENTFGTHGKADSVEASPGARAAMGILVGSLIGLAIVALFVCLGKRRIRAERRRAIDSIDAEEAAGYEELVEGSARLGCSPPENIVGTTVTVPPRTVLRPRGGDTPKSSGTPPPPPYSPVAVGFSGQAQTPGDIWRYSQSLHEQVLSAWSGGAPSRETVERLYGFEMNRTWGSLRR